MLYSSYKYSAVPKRKTGGNIVGNRKSQRRSPFWALLRQISYIRSQRGSTKIEHSVWWKCKKVSASLPWTSVWSGISGLPCDCIRQTAGGYGKRSSYDQSSCTDIYHALSAGRAVHCLKRKIHDFQGSTHLRRIVYSAVYWSLYQASYLRIWL